MSVATPAAPSHRRTVTASPSASIPPRVTVVAVSSDVVAVAAVATGASGWAATVTVTAAVALSAIPSFTMNWNVSVPLKSAGGV